MSRVPRIRFKGFEEDWEQRKLGEIGIIITGSTPSTSIKYYYTDDIDEGIVWVTPTDIINNITVESEKRLTSLGQKVAHIVPKNTILVTCIASIGKNTMLIDRGSFNQQINGLIPYENKYEPYFLLTESFIWSNKMKSSAPVGTMQIVNRKEFSEIDADIPDKSEQNSVGAFFRTLDHLITLHQRKLEKLKIIKKSMLENLFPQNGEKTSKIRFSGFTKDWEQRKLGEVCNIITKQTGFDYSSTIKPALLKEKADNTYPFIQNKDFNGTTINMDTDFFIPISIAEKFPNILLDRPSLLISISGRIGNVGFYSCVHKAFIGGAVGICKLKYDDDGKFIIHELESEYGQKYFRLLIKASSHANITVEDIRNIELIFPNQKEEKVCISTFFSTLDHLITLHQRKLDKLQKIKKSMLECMFI